MTFEEYINNTNYKYLSYVVLPKIIVNNILIINKENIIISYKDIYNYSKSLVHINYIDYMKVYRIVKNELSRVYNYDIVSILPIKIKRRI